MIVFYDSSGVATPLNGYENLSVTHCLDGCDTMTFYVDVTHPQYQELYEECRIIAEGNDWLIKKIDDDKIDCELNFDFLKTKIYSQYISETRSLQEVLEDHLPQGWTIEGGNLSSIRRTIEFDFCTDYDVINQCMSTYSVYFVWNIPEKRLIVNNPDMMPSSGEYLTSELNLTKLSFKGDTTEFATRLYAYGKDGLTMEKAIVDGKEYGLPYVENREYCDKTICAYWSDDRYTVAENLYNDAVTKLKTLSHPVRSYECEVVDLAKQNEKFSFLDFKMHKKITLIDVERGIKVEHQIVEYTEYPEEPSRNKVTLSCVPQTIQTSISEIQSAVNEDTDKIVTDFSQRITMATAMLTGAFGSYFHSDGANLYMMDNPDPELAQVVWRWNVNGFGKSSTGIEGPYTTALTFDDEFITNVVNAMVIRGSLIEAGSVEAGSISQSYTDEVLNQSYVAAEGLVQYMANEISNYLENEDGTGELDLLKETITQIKQTIDGLSVQVTEEFRGGINFIHNSSGVNGVSNDWSYTGYVSAEQSAEAVNNTVSGSMFCISDGTLSQDIEVISGESYTISMKVKRNTDSRCYACINNGGNLIYIFDEQTVSGWNDYLLTFEASGNSITAEFGTTNASLNIADIILVEGVKKANWTPAPNEIYTENVKIDRRGINITNSESATETIIDHTQFAVKHADEVVLTVNKDLTRLRRTEISEELTVGKGKFVPCSDGLDFVLLD